MMHRRVRTGIMQDRDLCDLWRIIGPVFSRSLVRIPRQPRNLLRDLHIRIVTLTKNRVAAIQTWIRNLRDEKLRTIGIRPSVGVSKSSWTVKQQIWRRFILKLVSGTSYSRAHGIAALNHELRNHPMKNGSAIERNSVHLLAGCGIRPILGSTREANEVRHANRSFIWEQGARHLARCGVDNCCWRSGCRRWFRRSRFLRRRRSLAYKGQ